jgi:CubicO group peptidase (beta-lactamase class C family)
MLRLFENCRPLLCFIVFALSSICLISDTRSQDAEVELPKGYRAVTDKVSSMEELCQATAETGLFSGAVLVAKDGTILYQHAFGMANQEWNIPNTVETKFRLASVSKQFCSLLILQLVQEGKLALDDTITDHLPYYRKDTGDRITIHHLLAHQCGLPDFTASFDYRGKVSRLSFPPDEFIKEYCSGDLQHDPGTIYSYCNAGYCILGRIIEKVTGKTFGRNLQERILDPVGMQQTGLDRNQDILPNRASGYTRGAFGLENADYISMTTTPGPAGGMYSTVGDMFLWDRALTTDKLLSKTYRDLMFTPNANVPEVKAAGGRARSIYGYGWQITTRTHPVTKRRTKVVSHGGAINGFRAMEYRLVDDDAFVIVLCNQGDSVGASDVWRSVTRLTGELMAIVNDQPYRMPGKPGLTQNQRMYNLAKADGVEAALKWFDERGKPAAWGGTFMLLAERLIADGDVESGLRLLEEDLQRTPSKVWMVRKTAQAFLDNGRYEKALLYANQGLVQRPDDERFLAIASEARGGIKPEEPVTE